MLLMEVLECTNIAILHLEQPFQILVSLDLLHFIVEAILILGSLGLGKEFIDVLLYSTKICFDALLIKET